MGKAQIRHYWKNREEILRENKNKDMKRQIEYLKKGLNNIYIYISLGPNLLKTVIKFHKLKLLMKLTRR